MYIADPVASVLTDGLCFIKRRAPHFAQQSSSFVNSTDIVVDHDNTFRLAYFVVVAVFLPFGMYYRIRSVTTERLDRWQEGALILFGLRLSAVPMFIGGVTWMINPEWMAWSAMPIPAWLRWLGIAFVATSCALVVWTFSNLGRNLTDTVVTRRDHTLIVSGPYRYVRHPFYVAIALQMLGGSLVTANWFILLAGVIPFSFLVARTRIEEQKLVDRFGAEYQEYMRRVGRFVPRFKL
jgi:protein-S-isoprenylcysteine O-methyltransferase Ste14